MEKLFFGFVPQDRDKESGEAIDADGLGAVRCSFVAIPIILVFWGVVIAFLR